MAEKDLVYYKQGIPAGHQMDKYSANPGCLFSKNVDIFSSSNSYKATAFTSPTAQDINIVDIDDKGRLALKTNGDVIDTWDNNTVITNCITRFSNVTLPISYTGTNPGSSAYATFGTPKRLIVKYEGDEWKEIVVYSDRTKYVRSSEYLDGVWDITYTNNCTATLVEENGKIVVEATEHVTNKTMTVRMRPSIIPGHSAGTIGIDCLNWQSGDVIAIRGAEIHTGARLVYDAELDRIIPADYEADLTVEGDTSLSGDTSYASVDYNKSSDIEIQLQFRYTSLASSQTQFSQIIIGAVGWTDEYWEFLPIDENRTIKDIGEYYFTAGKSSATLLKFRGEWYIPNPTSRPYQKKSRYRFEDYMAYEIDPASVAVDCVSFNEKVYLICNQDGNGYIFPCSLSGEKGTPYIAYGVEFKAAIVLNYLIYLVGENRGVSTLFIYSGTELVHVIEGNQKNGYWDDKVNKSEQFKFNGMMADWRGKLVLGTEDNRVFCYGQTFGGRGGSFIHSLAEGQVLESIRTIGKDLYIKYTETETSGGVETTVLKTIKYQDDTAIKNYNTEFEVVYPVVIGNHIIEKEVYDLYCSYRLPSVSTKLEFWLAVNHNYFWSFLTDGNTTPEVGDKFKISSCSGNYWLVFVEKVGKWLTFSLSGDLPYQALNTSNLVSEDTTVTIPFIEYNNFKRIRQITTDSFKEGFYREENITAKLGLPRVHSVQLMVRGIGTANYTPEVFGVSLDSNQRNRG